MEKLTIVYKESVDKKYSVRFSNRSPGVAISDIYIKRSALGETVPRKIRVTVEDVSLQAVG